MIAMPTSHPEVLLVRSPVHEDDRGAFSELHRADQLAAAGLPFTFVQDNFSRSRRNVLRGLHFQRRNPQGKFVRVLSGRIFDVAVDLREASPRFGEWVGATLDAALGDALWVPPGFAHGFLVLDDSADVFYKCTASYTPADEYVVRWDDPQLGIDWPLHGPPVLSSRDAVAPPLADALRAA